MGGIFMTFLKPRAPALATVAALFVAASPAHADEAKPAGVFVQCDGRTGHVDAGEGRRGSRRVRPGAGERERLLPPGAAGARAIAALRRGQEMGRGRGGR